MTIEDTTQQKADSTLVHKTQAKKTIAMPFELRDEGIAIVFSMDAFREETIEYLVTQEKAYKLLLDTLWNRITYLDHLHTPEELHRVRLTEAKTQSPEWINTILRYSTQAVLLPYALKQKTSIKALAHKKLVALEEKVELNRQNVHISENGYFFFNALFKDTLEKNTAKHHLLMDCNTYSKTASLLYKRMLPLQEDVLNEARDNYHWLFK